MEPPCERRDQRHEGYDADSGQNWRVACEDCTDEGERED